MSRMVLIYRPDHPKADKHGFVDVNDLGIEQAPLARNAPIMTDRWYEGTVSTDGVDIGSRRKREEYKRANDLIDYDEVKPDFARARAEREKFRRGEWRDPKTREVVGRAMYEIEKKGRR